MDRPPGGDENAIFAETFRQVPVGVQIWQLVDRADAHSLVLRAANPRASELLGIALEEAIGKRVVEIYPRLRDTDLMEKYASVARTGQGVDLGEFEYSDARVRARIWAVRAFPLPGDCLGVLFEDVTERKLAADAVRRAHAEALESSRLKSEFLANMSHELRTPLNAILGMSSMLLDSPLGNEQREFAGVVHAAGEALLGVVENLFDVARLESGRLALESRAFDLHAVAQAAGHALVQQARGKPVAVTVRCDAPARVIGDEARLRQLLMHLGGNAVKFTSQGQVHLRLTRVGTAVRGEVEDTGIGLDEADAARLFEPFRQVDGSSTRRFGGAGLGLAVSKGLVGLMGGTIGVRSVPGEGSTFWFEVPLPLRPARVLVADASEVSRLILMRFLESLGCAVESAGSGPAALARLDLARFDAVLVDAQLPPADGYAFAAQIRARSSQTGTPADVPVVCLTDEVPRRADYAHLTRPVSVEDLRAALAL